MMTRKTWKNPQLQEVVGVSVESGKTYYYESESIEPYPSKPSLNMGPAS